jgi:hypothetical protein
VSGASPHKSAEVHGERPWRPLRSREKGGSCKGDELEKGTKDLKLGSSLVGVTMSSC